MKFTLHSLLFVCSLVFAAGSDEAALQEQLTTCQNTAEQRVQDVTAWYTQKLQDSETQTGALQTDKEHLSTRLAESEQRTEELRHKAARTEELHQTAGADVEAARRSLEEQVRQLEQQVREGQEAAVEALVDVRATHEAALADLHATYGQKLQQNEQQLASESTAKRELSSAVENIKSQVETGKSELLQVRRELLKANEQVQNLEKDKLYYWDLLASCQEQMLEWWKQFVHFWQTDPRIQSVSTQVTQAVQPYWTKVVDAVHPYWTQVAEATQPARESATEMWATNVEPFLSTQRAAFGKLFCKMTQKLAHFVELQDGAPKFVQTSAAKLNTHCESTLYYGERALALWFAYSIVRWLFSSKKKKQQKKVAVKQVKGANKKKKKTH